MSQKERVLAPNKDEMVQMIAKELPIKVSMTAIEEVLKAYGRIGQRLLKNDVPLSVPGVGIIKPCMLAGREYHNLRGGQAIQVAERKSIKVDIATALKREFGR